MEYWSDEKFLGYMTIHSKTERALFRNDYVDRLTALAGKEDVEHREWVSWHYRDMKPYLDAAYKNLTT